MHSWSRASRSLMAVADQLLRDGDAEVDTALAQVSARKSRLRGFERLTPRPALSLGAAPQDTGEQGAAAAAGAELLPSCVVGDSVRGRGARTANE